MCFIIGPQRIPQGSIFGLTSIAIYIAMMEIKNNASNRAISLYADDTIL